MLRCLGASEARTLALFVAQFVVLGLVASAIGVVLALGGQALLVSLLRVAHGGRAAVRRRSRPASPRSPPACCCCSASRCRR